MGRYEVGRSFFRFEARSKIFTFSSFFFPPLPHFIVLDHFTRILFIITSFFLIITPFDANQLIHSYFEINISCCSII